MIKHNYSYHTEYTPNMGFLSIKIVIESSDTDKMVKGSLKTGLPENTISLLYKHVSQAKTRNHTFGVIIAKSVFEIQNSIVMQKTDRKLEAQKQRRCEH